MTELKLEDGLDFYYTHEREFNQRGIPIDRQVALAFETGRAIGRHEVRIEGEPDDRSKDNWK